MKLSKAVVISVSVILLLLISTPIVFYVIYFNNQTIGSDPTSWGTFGDFIGGVLNPIISLASLFVLGYLTYLVATQTNKENQNLFLLERRMSAYDELAKHVKEINMMKNNMDSTLLLSTLYTKLNPDKAIDLLFQNLKELRVVSNVYSDFYYTLFGFNVRYGHLFKYDFNCEEFTELTLECKKVKDKMNLLFDNIVEPNESTKFSDSDMVLKPYVVQLLAKVVNDIREEVHIGNA